MFVSEAQSVSEKLVYGVEKNSTLLECSARSLQAILTWYIVKGTDMEEVYTHTQTKSYYFTLRIIFKVICN